MADFRLPGPVDGSRQRAIVEDGTSMRRAMAVPGPLGASMVTIGPGGLGTPPTVRVDDGWWSYAERAADVYEALQRARTRVGAAVLKRTDEAIDALLEGLIPALLGMIAVMVITSAVGGLAGAALGALLGGVGAVPGAAAGAKAGVSLGVWLLTWLGLGFLVVEIARGLGEMSAKASQAVQIAWDAHGHADSNSRIDRAADELADAVALLIQLILMAIVARLTYGQAKAGNAGAAASMDELLASLRQSRLGASFADWVAASAPRLMRNPKLRKHREVQGTQAASQAGTPSQLKAQSQNKAEPESTQPPAAHAGLAQKKVPCFHPFDKQKFQALDPEAQKAYLKEMSKQLKRQQEQINDMSAAEFKAARDAFERYGRNPMAEGAQAGYRRSFAKDVQSSIAKSLSAGDMGVAQAEQIAIARTKELMGKLAALHEPDMVAGGWLQPAPKGMGRADVNASIGGSWPHDGRVKAMDEAADAAILSGQGDKKMNVKLEPCRGKDMK